MEFHVTGSSSIAANNHNNIVRVRKLAKTRKKRCRVGIVLRQGSMYLYIVTQIIELHRVAYNE